MGHALTKSKNTRTEKRKFVSEEYFIRNGSILLEKQIALSQGQEKGDTQLKLYSSKDLDRATNGYNQAVLLSNIRRAIYKGTLDDRTVVVKSFPESKQHPGLIDRFLTEAATGMVMNHRNITRFYGCCLESYIPLLVYEYLQNGGLADQLHRQTASQKRLKWSHRLSIAIDVAYALSYMHTALSKPVVHRDVTSMSVLIDESFNAKLTNLGYSVSITPGDSPQKLPIVGTVGYVDPEYIQTNEVTDKCDVYSFGVLMLELLTGKSPKHMANLGKNMVDLFVATVQDDCMMEMIDSVVLEQARLDEVQSVTWLALKCVREKGEERPTMVQVVEELWLIQGRGHRVETE